MQFLKFGIFEKKRKQKSDDNNNHLRLKLPAMLRAGRCVNSYLCSCFMLSTCVLDCFCARYRHVHCHLYFKKMLKTMFYFSTGV